MQEIIRARALALVQAMQDAGLTFFHDAAGRIRSNQYTEGISVPCCPMAALYQHDTGDKAGNMAVDKWCAHFLVQPEAIRRVMNASDIPKTNEVREQLLQMVQ